MRDFEIRQLLRKTELKKYRFDPHSKIVEELRLTPAAAQVDIAVLNGAFHAFEIKSAVDSLNRLPNQIDAYSKIFDFVTVVTEARHESKILDMTPSWIGVSVCQGHELIIVRKALSNNLIDGFHLAQLLWRDEIISLLRSHNIQFNTYQRNWILCEILASSLCSKSISELVRTQLKNRINWKELAES